MYENKSALGYQNFEEVRTEHIFYIDKTDFVREWWEYADKVTLITRPRRFGKILNMSMVECFFSNQRPRCKQRGIKLATLQSSGVFDPRGIRQMLVQARHMTHCSRE